MVQRHLKVSEVSLIVVYQLRQFWYWDWLPGRLESEWHLCWCMLGLKGILDRCWRHQLIGWLSCWSRLGVVHRLWMMAQLVRW